MFLISRERKDCSRRPSYPTREVKAAVCGFQGEQSSQALTLVRPFVLFFCCSLVKRRIFVLNAISELAASSVSYRGVYFVASSLIEPFFLVALCSAPLRFSRSSNGVRARLSPMSGSSQIGVC